MARPTVHSANYLYNGMESCKKKNVCEENRIHSGMRNDLFLGDAAADGELRRSWAEEGPESCGQLRTGGSGEGEGGVSVCVEVWGHRLV